MRFSLAFGFFAFSGFSFSSDFFLILRYVVVAGYLDNFFSTLVYHACFLVLILCFLVSVSYTNIFALMLLCFECMRKKSNTIMMTVMKKKAPEPKEILREKKKVKNMRSFETRRILLWRSVFGRCINYIEGYINSCIAVRVIRHYLCCCGCARHLRIAMT